MQIHVCILLGSRYWYCSDNFYDDCCPQRLANTWPYRHFVVVMKLIQSRRFPDTDNHLLPQRIQKGHTTTTPCRTNTTATYAQNAYLQLLGSFSLNFPHWQPTSTIPHADIDKLVCARIFYFDVFSLVVTLFVCHQSGRNTVSWHYGRVCAHSKTRAGTWSLRTILIALYNRHETQPQEDRQLLSVMLYSVLDGFPSSSPFR